MKVHYDLERLRRILKDLSILTGISLSLQDADRKTMILSARENDYCTAIQQRGDFEKCRSCDMALLDRCNKSLMVERHTCHAGLCDLAMPVIKDGVVAGYLLMGRIRSPQSPAHSKDGELEQLYRQIPVFSDEKINSLVDLLPQILFEKNVALEQDDLARQAAEYIDAHFSGKLSVDHLCSTLHISKNRLYEVFHAHFGCTVNAYLTQRRIEQAKRLLAETEEPVYWVAEQIGIDNYTYFCRLFKEKTGVTPMQYRKTK